VTSTKVFSEISELMERLQEIGKHCCVLEGRVILAVGFGATCHSQGEERLQEKETLQKLLATVVHHIPESPRPDLYYETVDVKRIVVEMHRGCVDIELELLPPVSFPGQ